MNTNINIRWITITAALLIAVVIGTVAYNAGVAQGIAQAGNIVAAPSGPYAQFPWHHPGAFMFPFAFMPFVFMLICFLIVPALFFGGWHRGGHRHVDR